MGKNKRINPYKQSISLTAGDLKKVKKQVENEVLTYAWAIFFTVMRDKFGWGNIRLRRLWDEVNNKSDAIIKGYVSLQDMIDILQQEADITFAKS